MSQLHYLNEAIECSISNDEYELMRELVGLEYAKRFQENHDAYMIAVQESIVPFGKTVSNVPNLFPRWKK